MGRDMETAVFLIRKGLTHAAAFREAKRRRPRWKKDWRAFTYDRKTGRVTLT